ncbi:hypothetical protein [Methanobrevibacter sp. UBA337]|jgi:integrase|uniref:hypothetical protein n=1 Tax=Methanobrevibacter sp. UBA337 TaxID=1915480 RepID=UPI0039B976C6
MNILDDPKLQHMFIYKKLSQGTINNYKVVFKEVYEATGYTPEELLQRVRKEQRNPYKQVEGEKVYIEKEDRFITRIILQYMRFEEDKQIQNTTLFNKQRILRAFFAYYDIDLPKSIPLIIQHKRIRKKDLPNLSDIQKAVESSKNWRDKSLIKLLSDSGLRTSDAIKLTINDFKKSVKPYMKKMKFEEFIYTDPSGIIPCFDIIPEKTKKKGNIQITFATPEFVYYVFEHLKERHQRGLPLTDDEPLLMSYRTHTFIRKGAVPNLFSVINDTIFQGSMVNDRRFFRAHNLRKFFRTTLKNNMKLIDKQGYNDMNVADIVRVMCGHIPDSNIEEAYDAVDPDIMYEYYLQVMPKLLFKDIPVEHIKSPKFLELEQERDKAIQEKDEIKENFEENIMKILEKNGLI